MRSSAASQAPAPTPKPPRKPALRRDYRVVVAPTEPRPDAVDALLGWLARRARR
jgi:hypothetical protein